MSASQTELEASNAKLQVFEERLLQYVEAYKNVKPQDMSNPWVGALSKRTARQWADDISKITIPAAKILLGGEDEPTDSQLIQQLPVVVDQRAFGVYHGTITTPTDPQDSHGYTGSATSKDGGLALRTKQHRDAKYREWTRSQGYSSYHYSAVDAKGKTRNAVYAVLGQANVYTKKNERKAERRHDRETCKLAEQIYMGWLRTFVDGTLKKYPWLRDLTPWKTPALRRGTNASLPIQESIPESSIDKTYQEYCDFTMAYERHRRSEQTVEQREAERQRTYRYDHEVRLPAQKMKAQGASDAEIKAFKEAHKENVKKEGRGMNWVNGAGYVFPTATPRSEEERARDLAGGRKPKRKVIDAATANAPAPKRIRDRRYQMGQKPHEVDDETNEPIAPNDPVEWNKPSATSELSPIEADPVNDEAMYNAYTYKSFSYRSYKPKAVRPQKGCTVDMTPTTVPGIEVPGGKVFSIFEGAAGAKDESTKNEDEQPATKTSTKQAKKNIKEPSSGKSSVTIAQPASPLESRGVMHPIINPAPSVDNATVENSSTQSPGQVSTPSAKTVSTQSVGKENMQPATKVTKKPAKKAWKGTFFDSISRQNTYAGTPGSSGRVFSIFERPSA